MTILEGIFCSSHYNALCFTIIIIIIIIMILCREQKRTMVLVNSVGKQTSQLTNTTFTSSHLY